MHVRVYLYLPDTASPSSVLAITLHIVGWQLKSLFRLVQAYHLKLGSPPMSTPFFWDRPLNLALTCVLWAPAKTRDLFLFYLVASSGIFGSWKFHKSGGREKKTPYLSTAWQGLKEHTHLPNIRVYLQQTAWASDNYAVLLWLATHTFLNGMSWSTWNWFEQFFCLNRLSDQTTGRRGWLCKRFWPFFQGPWLACTIASALGPQWEVWLCHLFHCSWRSVWYLHLSMWPWSRYCDRRSWWA